MKSLSEIWPEHKGKGDLIDSRSKAIAKMVADRTKDLRTQERSGLLLLFRYDARQIVTSGRLLGECADAVGARNVAKSADGRQRQRHRFDGADLRRQPRRRLHHELHGRHARRPL